MLPDVAFAEFYNLAHGRCLQRDHGSNGASAGISAYNSSDEQRFDDDPL